MGYKKIAIDDNYIVEMSKYFDGMSEELEKMYGAYLSIMREIIEDGICSGRTSLAIGAFIGCAEKMQQAFQETGELAKNASLEYLDQIDEKDNSLF